MPQNIQGETPAASDQGARAIAESFGIGDAWPLLRDRMVRAGAWTLREAVK